MNIIKFSGYSNSNKERGVSIILVAIFLVLFIGIAALALDYGRYMVTRNELQNIADGAALAACRELGSIYSSMGNYSKYTLTAQEVENIKTKAQEVGNLNRAGGKQGISIRLDDILIGTWWKNSSPPYFAETAPPFYEPHAVKVTVRRDSIENDPVVTLFANIFKQNEMADSKSAVASLSGLGKVLEGEVELPIGISSYFFEDGNFCNDFIVFNPTNDPQSCAGWNNFAYSPANDNQTREILDGELESPAIIAGNTFFNFIGGDLSNQTFNSLLSLFGRKGYDVRIDGETPVLTTQKVDENGDPIFDENEDPVMIPVVGPLGPEDVENADLLVPVAEDGLPLVIDNVTRLDKHGDPLEQGEYPDGTKRNLHLWPTTVVVYDWDDCSNPNTSIRIVGFATILMTNVDTQDKRIEGEILCEEVEEQPSHGGGGAYGTFGPIPSLVQ